jgi:hypothetical protein
MKLIATLFISLTINFCFGQTNILSENFLSSWSDQCTQEELNDNTQYYRLLLPLRKWATYSKAVELKSKTVHANKNSRFQERNQLVGFYAFEYPNKKVCRLAVDSLLQCFPNFCVQVERGKPISDKITPSVYVINDKTVYCIETFCEDVNEQWEEILKSFVDAIAVNSSTIILTGCGKLEWTTKEKMKK